MNQNEAIVAIVSGLGCSFEKVRQAYQQLEQTMGAVSNEWYRKFDKRQRKNALELYNYRQRRIAL